MFTVRGGPGIGLIANVAGLAGLAGTVGLDAAGWLAGLTVGLIVHAWLTGGLARAGRTLGPADRVTLIRATLVAGVTALVADPSGPGHIGVLVGLASVALVLDAVDGRVARRTGTESGLGARFDMEVDAFLILVLSVSDARIFGGWVLAIGAARYVFVAAAVVWPWLREATPPRHWCKVVAATQGITLTAVATELISGPVAVGLILAALALLAESFGREVQWLVQHRGSVAPRPNAGVAIHA